MINRIIYSIFTVFFMLKGINAQTVGFVPVSTNYYEAFPENTSGTFDIAISGTGGGAFTATFYIKADYSSDISTAKRSNTGTTNGYGQGYWKDFSTSLNWSSSDYTVNDENVSTIVTNNSSGLQWRMTLIGSGDGSYTVQIPIHDDVRYEAVLCSLPGCSLCSG